MDALRITLCVILVSSLVSCSKVDTWKDQISGDTEETEGFEEDELASEGEDGFDDAEYSEAVEDETVDEVVDNAKTASEEYDAIESAPRMPADEATTTPEPEEMVATGFQGNGMREYMTQKNDTLMWISFKMYGNYLKWREILRANPGLNPNEIAPGTKLQYPALGAAFDWDPQGKPYLIITGDTLRLISGKVYGSQDSWKSIWDNNRQMIKNPNLIFAGFTIYYLDGESVAALDSQ